MKNIILIGMSGCGKSTAGVLLAKAMNMDFTDTDILIQNREGKFLWQILEIEGTERFKCIEESVILSLERENTCIATGGSVVYSEKSMHHLKRNSIIIFIDVSYEDIEKRISNISTRGVVIEEGKTLRDLYYERLPLYEKYADIIIDAGDMSAEQVIFEIIRRMRYEAY